MTAEEAPEAYEPLVTEEPQRERSTTVVGGEVNAASDEGVSVGKRWSEPLEAVEIDDVVESGSAEPIDISAELREAEEVRAEEVTAVLTAVLDRLGAAHHRPFSRG
jgi:hypothetical protein